MSNRNVKSYLSFVVIFVKIVVWVLHDFFTIFVKLFTTQSFIIQIPLNIDSSLNSNEYHSVHDAHLSFISAQSNWKANSNLNFVFFVYRQLCSHLSL